MDNEHERRLTDCESRSKSNSHRLDEIEKRQGDQEKLIATVAVLAARQETVENDVKEIKVDVKGLAAKPAKRWDNLVDKIITTIAAAVIGFLLAHIGL